jgi:uncharacterized protein (DUF305 family)
MNTFARSGAAALAVALTFSLAACGGTSNSATSTSPAASPTVAAGSSDTASAMMSSPMMSGQGSAMTSQPPASADHNAADLSFTQQMIVHHQGAVEMADLAPTRADNQQVKELAITIKAAQTPEIEQMTGWLTLWGSAMSTSNSASTTSDDGMDDMNHGGMSETGSTGEMRTGPTGMAMPGMMSDAQLQELTAASGAEFDRLFLQLMIVHHQGAIEMADTEIADGSNPAAVALAKAIKASQTAEIAEMQQLLQTL